MFKDCSALHQDLELSVEPSTSAMITEKLMNCLITLKITPRIKMFICGQLAPVLCQTVSNFFID